MFASADTSQWSVESIAAVVSAAVLVLGAITAARYGYRASGTVKGTLFRRNGAYGMFVESDIINRGIRRFKVVQKGQYVPRLSVTEVADDGLRYHCLKCCTTLYLKEIVIDPGENHSWTHTFHLPPPGQNCVGWRVEFSFAIKNRIRSKLPWSDHKYWQWEEEAFIPIPQDETTSVNPGSRPPSDDPS